MSFPEAIKNLLFPVRCLTCDRQLGHSRLPQLCDDCRPLFSPIASPLCPGCGKPYQAGEDHFCGDCLLDYFAFDLARAMFLYQEPVKSLLLSFKFGGRLTGLATMGTLTKQSGVDTLFSEPDLVLPIPLHIRRLRSRGLISPCCWPEPASPTGRTKSLQTFSCAFNQPCPRPA